MEELDEETRLQLIPSGFHVIYMPYADDFRQISNKTEAKGIFFRNIKTVEIV